MNQLQQDQAALRNEKGEEQQIEHPQLEALDAAYDYVLGEYKTYLSTEGKFSPSPLPKEGEEFKYYVDIFLQVLQPHIEGKASFAFVRQQLRPAYDRLKKEIRAEGAANIQNNLQICMDLKDDAVISLILYIKSLGFLVNLKEQSLEEKMQSEAYRAYQDHYLALHEELEPIGNLQTLQQWLNNLDNFKTLRPLQYEPPKQEESREVEFIFEDENEKETLETLIKEILDNIPLEEVEDNEKGKEIEKEADPFEQAVNDYAMELAVSLYKTFEVSSPCRLYRQEFDGLVSRDGQLTIIERKTNDGTGPGVLQRNFCQQKIMSKEQFVQKNWLPAILHDAHPESFIDIHIPARKDWYCEEFSEEIQDMLILAAKLTVVKALRELRLEFNLNLPKHYSGKVYQGVFFSPSRLNDVTVRFSQLRKGDEDVAHSRMDEIRSSMSQMIRRGQ